jgi:hypothetical protein
MFVSTILQSYMVPFQANTVNRGQMIWTSSDLYNLDQICEGKYVEKNEKESK